MRSGLFKYLHTNRGRGKILFMGGGGGERNIVFIPIFRPLEEGKEKRMI
jgi:hypothetical protein